MMGDGLMDAIDGYAPPFDGEPRRWDDVLRRAGWQPAPRRRRTAVVVAAVGLAAAVAVAAAPAIGVGGRLLDLVGAGNAPKPHLPKAADRAHVAMVLDPHTRRVLLLVAPRRAGLGDGICFVYFPTAEFGCSLRSRHGGGFGGGTRPFGYSFDRRAASADARLASGRRVELRFVRFRGRIGTSFFFTAAPLQEPVTQYWVRDRAGTVIQHGHLRLAG